ncbi:MAG: putative lipid II flippase FtsW [Acidobacteria bacterium]|jgi:cell division protein FtsW|nr:putative lipid II flippase FtsW [Acidobacteriota bacterium]
MTKKLRIDWFLFVIAASLALFGVIMVYSASAMIALKETQGESQFTYFYKQFSFTLAGLAVMYLSSKIDYRWYQKSWVVYGLLALTVVLLFSVFNFPPINGARRWIRYSGYSFQPSEVAKIALPVFLAFFLTKNEETIGELKETVLPCAAVFAFLCALILVEPDLGTVIILSIVFTVVYFAAGARILHIGSVIAGCFLIGAIALISSPYRRGRIFAFLNPWENADDAAYQVVQGLYAIGSGGIFGEGFAKGQQKLFYLPYPYSDFIFAVVGEELGLIGTLAVVAAFGLMLWRGARAALLAPDRFGKLLGMGIITGIIVQALFNISVVVSILPAKGIPLPFISYGGSSVVVTLFAVGILLNLSQHAGIASFEKAEEKEIPTRRKKRKSLQEVTESYR